VASSFLPYEGGVERHVAAVAEKLVARGHDVQVWTVARNGKLQRYKNTGVEVTALPAPLPNRSLKGVLRWIWQSPGAILHWIGVYRQFNPELLHVQCLGPNGTYAWILSALTRRPIILSSHGETMADQDDVFSTSMIAQMSLRLAIHRAAHVTGCSTVVLHDLEERFGLTRETGAVVPNGVELDGDKLACDAASEEVTVLAIGRLVRVKGFDLLIEAFSRAETAPNVRLVIGGDGPERAALLDQAANTSCASRISLPGRLSPNEVRKRMSKARMVVIPSRFEAFGITALEAWREGVPVIATLRGGLPEFVSDAETGFLIDPEDTGALARSIETLLQDPGLANSMGRRGAQRVRDLTWDATTTSYEAIYRSAITRSARQPQPRS